VFSIGRPPFWQAVRSVGLAVTVAGAALLAGAGWPAQARGSVEPIPTVALSQLPGEVQATETLIRKGGPFPYPKDGTVFGNRERQLPAHPRGFYREYTVKTPGSRDRGARRIICGGRQTTNPEACFYTDDHYMSFRRIVQ
jgi:ribonuclease T1